MSLPGGYSLIMPYFHRPNQLYNTLSSMRFWYTERSEYEIIIVEDHVSADKPEWSAALRDVVELYPDIDIRVLKAGKEGISSSHNYGVSKAKYDYIVFNGPEILHYRNVLDTYDRFFEGFPDQYAVGSCWLSTFPGRVNKVYPPGLESQGFCFKGWYQHGVVHNRLLHFNAAMRKSIFEDIGGFCVDFDEGIAWEDDDFVQQVLHEGITIKAVDAVQTTHQEHPVVNKIDRAHNGWKRNHDIFVRRQENRIKSI